MSEIEERLRAALAARADQVRPETLRQDPPGPVARPWWRAPGSYGLLAAVAVLVLAIPVAALVLLRGGDEVSPATGPASPSPSQTTTADGRTWTETASRVADFDGDGADDVARVLAVDSTTETGEVRVEVALAAGGRAVWGVPVGQRPVTLTDAADVDLDGVPEVLVEVGAEPRALVVLAVAEDSDLLEVLHAGDRISRGTGLEDFAHHWWVDSEGLWSWVSSVRGQYDRERFRVELLHWLPGGGLQPTPKEICWIYADAPEDPQDCHPPRQE